jgi:hypothetical protein
MGKNLETRIVCPAALFFTCGGLLTCVFTDIDYYTMETVFIGIPKPKASPFINP